jgi:hypothetical protein
MACTAKTSNRAMATPGSDGTHTHAQVPAGQQSGDPRLPLPWAGLDGMSWWAAIPAVAASSWHAVCEGLIVPAAMWPTGCCCPGEGIGIDVDARADPLRITLMHSSTRQRTA